MKLALADLFSRDRPVIPVVRLSGLIGAASRFRPGASMESLAGPLAKAFAMRGAPAVAVIVNSPGGAPVQSHLIYRRIRHLAAEKQKRVFVFIEDVAASGGYLVALAGDEIIADPTSIVGSIGVISAGFGFTGLIEKLGVERRVYAAGEHKAMLDPFRPEQADDVARLKALQADVHALFIKLVRDRRGAKLADDPDLFTGAFWTGERSVALGLADRTGDILSVMRERYGEKVRLKVIASERSLWRRRLGFVRHASAAGGADLAADLAGPAIDAMMAALEERAWWARYGL